MENDNAQYYTFASLADLDVDFALSFLFLSHHFDTLIFQCLFEKLKYSYNYVKETRYIKQK